MLLLLHQSTLSRSLKCWQSHNLEIPPAILPFLPRACRLPKMNTAVATVKITCCTIDAGIIKKTEAEPCKRLSFMMALVLCWPSLTLQSWYFLQIDSFQSSYVTETGLSLSLSNSLHVECRSVLQAIRPSSSMQIDIFADFISSNEFQ
jgi:hypothetical protein